MFTEEQLEGVPSPQLEEWLQENYEMIDHTFAEMLTVSNDFYEEAETILIQLLIKCWDAKKCPYA